MNYLLFALILFMLILAILTLEFEERIYSILCLELMTLSVGLLLLEIGATITAVFHLLVYSGVLTVLYQSSSNFFERDRILSGKSTNSINWIRSSFLVSLAIVTLYLMVQVLNDLSNEVFSTQSGTDLSSQDEGLLPLWTETDQLVSNFSLGSGVLVIGIMLLITAIAVTNTTQILNGKEVKHVN